MGVLFNGSIIGEEDAVLLVSDKAIWFDFGVYESIKVIQGKAFYADKHIARFFRSAECIGMKMGFSQKEVLEWISMFISHEKLDNALLRLFAYGDTEKNKQVRIYVFALGLTFYPNSFYSLGAKAITYPGERFMPDSKSFNLLLNFLAYKKAQENEAIEALLIDKEGFVREGTRSNLFIIEKNIIVTPPASQVLLGVTRDLLMQWVRKKDWIVIEEKISKVRLREAREVMITSTSMNVMPIVMIDNQQVGDGKVGERTRELYLLFREKQREYSKKM